MPLLELSSFYGEGFLLVILLAIRKCTGLIGLLSSVVISCAVLYKLRQAELICSSLVTKQ